MLQSLNQHHSVTRQRSTQSKGATRRRKRHHFRINTTHTASCACLRRTHNWKACAKCDHSKNKDLMHLAKRTTLTGLTPRHMHHRTRFFQARAMYTWPDSAITPNENSDQIVHDVFLMAWASGSSVLVSRTAQDGPALFSSDYHDHSSNPRRRQPPFAYAAC